MSIKMSFLLRNLCNKNIIKLINNSVPACANTSNIFFNRNIHILSKNLNSTDVIKNVSLKIVQVRTKYNKSGKKVPDDEVMIFIICKSFKNNLFVIG